MKRTRPTVKEALAEVNAYNATSDVCNCEEHEVEGSCRHNRFLRAYADHLRYVSKVITIAGHTSIYGFWTLLSPKERAERALFLELDAPISKSRTDYLEVA